MENVPTPKSSLMRDYQNRGEIPAQFRRFLKSSVELRRGQL
jgi:hypothetical protein